MGTLRTIMFERLLLAAVLAVALLLALAGNAAAQNKYTNPVNPASPDPRVFYDKKSKTYYVSLTGEQSDGIMRILSSTDLVHWSLAGHMFSQSNPPSWSFPLGYRSPSIKYINGKYVAVYTASCSGQWVNRSRHANPNCIGIAHATSPTGPWIDSGKPLIQRNWWMNFGATIYKSPTDHKVYVVWKAFDTRGGHGVGYNYGLQLNDEMTATVGTKWAKVISKTEKWEGLDNHFALEGAFMYFRKPYFYLFYSVGDWESPTCNYAIGVARSKGPLGPFVKPKGPLVHKSSHWCNPGAPSVARFPSDPKRTVLVMDAQIKNVKASRDLVVDELHWHPNGWPYVANGVVSAGPVPYPH